MFLHVKLAPIIGHKDSQPTEEKKKERKYYLKQPPISIIFTLVLLSSSVPISSQVLKYFTSENDIVLVNLTVHIRHRTVRQHWNKHKLKKLKMGWGTPPHGGPGGGGVGMKLKEWI